VGLIIPIVLLGLLASLSPSTIVVFILLLATTRARVNATAFLVGWCISLIIVFAASYALGGVRASQHGSGRIAVEVVEIVLGVVLCFLAAQQWRRRDIPRTGSVITKRLTGRLKNLSPWEAAIVGVLEQPWTLTAAVAVVLVRHHSATFIDFVALLVFTVLSTATVGLIFVYFARRPGEAEGQLSTLRNRVMRASPVIFAIVSLVVGLFLIVDSILRIVGV
jgi:threonine/homoserine/homoserine lactone efflux protein